MLVPTIAPTVGNIHIALVEIPAISKAAELIERISPPTCRVASKAPLASMPELDGGSVPQVAIWYIPTLAVFGARIGPPTTETHFAATGLVVAVPEIAGSVPSVVNLAPPTPVTTVLLYPVIAPKGTDNEEPEGKKYLISSVSAIFLNRQVAVVTGTLPPAPGKSTGQALLSARVAA